MECKIQIIIYIVILVHYKQYKFQIQCYFVLPIREPFIIHDLK